MSFLATRMELTANKPASFGSSMSFLLGIGRFSFNIFSVKQILLRIS
ncbi:hypothetical protein LINPERHAP2_LOCUS33179 [Linum perenne]